MVSNNPLIMILILITYDDANDENNNDYRISTHDKKSDRNQETGSNSRN